MSKASAASGAKKDEVPQFGRPSYDLAEYAGRYAGRGKIMRLKFIGEHCAELCTAALRACVDELKTTLNTTVYKDVMKLSNESLGAGYTTDAAWIEAMDNKAQVTMEKLEMDLNGYKTNLVKESIRLGHIELGDFHFGRGDLNAALKCYVRTRDYSPLPQHSIEMCQKVVKTAINLGNYAHVASYVSKALGTPELTDATIISQMKVAMGLSQLANRKYEAAAEEFLQVTLDLGTSFNDVLSQEDVALYGALCALASFDRNKLKNEVIEASGPFSSFLELSPIVREIVSDFYHCRYASCFQQLDKIKNDVMLDMFLSPHGQYLLQTIRQKALKQYFRPYLSVDLNAMAAAFNTTLAGLEHELHNLIMDGQIEARIDSGAKVLYARLQDVRSSTFDRAMTMGAAFESEANTTIRRLNMSRNDFFVRPALKGAGLGRGMAQMLMSALRM